MILFSLSSCLALVLDEQQWVMITAFTSDSADG